MTFIKNISMVENVGNAPTLPKAKDLQSSPYL